MATTKLKRTRDRMWLGNGMGYDPAEYAIIRNDVFVIGRIQFYAGSWNVDDPRDPSLRRRNFFSFREARHYALTSFEPE